jgi:hypothetical protein
MTTFCVIVVCQACTRLSLKIVLGCRGLENAFWQFCLGTYVKIHLLVITRPQFYRNLPSYICIHCPDSISRPCISSKMATKPLDHAAKAWAWPFSYLSTKRMNKSDTYLCKCWNRHPNVCTLLQKLNPNSSYPGMSGIRANDLQFLRWPLRHAAKAVTYHVMFYISTHLRLGCQMVCFQTKNPNLGKFWRALEWIMLLCIFYGHLVMLW